MMVCASGASFYRWQKRRLSSALIVAGARWKTARVAWVETVGYGGCAWMVEVIRHGISSEILLMGWPSAIFARMSLR